MSRYVGSAGVIGWPVGHSRSPAIHRFWLERLGLEGDFSRFPVRPEALGAAVREARALGLSGLSVTVPHKESIVPFLDTLTPEARAVGAVNCVVLAPQASRGTNTDVAGFLEPLADLSLEGAHAAVIGAGGAARAVLVGLRSRGIGRITILNRTVERGAALLREFGIDGQALPLGARLPEAVLLVNASTLGMDGAPRLDLDLAPLAPGAVVYDIVFSPLETDLLRAARRRGLAVIDGLSMLIGQADPAFRLFFGEAPPRDLDDVLRARLTA